MPINDHGVAEHPFSITPNPPHPPLKGYRTVLWSALTVLGGVLTTIDWNAIIPASWVGIVIAGIGLVNAVCRYFTNTPVTVAVPPVAAVAEVIKKHEASIPPHVIEALKVAAPDAKL